MAVTKTTRTRLYMYGSKTDHRKTTQVTPSLHHFFKEDILLSSAKWEQHYTVKMKKKRCRDEVTCEVFL